MNAIVSPMLTDDDLIALTGYKSPACQRGWLTRNGIAFLTARNGRARVLWAAIEARQGLRVNQQQEAEYTLGKIR